MGVPIVPSAFQVVVHLTYDMAPPPLAASSTGATVIDEFPMVRDLQFYKCCAWIMDF